jgi:DHA1 family bicyclomycin/chloramphenicol resistance-like MFS transporter
MSYPAPMNGPTKPLSMPEFVTLLAMMISILALSIDAMLPALAQIGSDLGVEDANDTQLVVTGMFLGFAAGQIIAGPLSDSFGRKPVIYVGYGVFIIGCLMSMAATNFEIMLSGRVLQGLGAASPRIVSLALVRDGYEGRAMARIMSIVMAIFILVPAIAPSIGEGVLLIADWRAIFGLLLVMAITATIWFAARQPETLAASERRKFSPGNILGGIKEACGYRAALGYTIASGIIFGAFLGYLSSAQQVFQTVYDTGKLFALYFGVAALAIGAASVFNSKVVMQLGMRFMTWRALIAVTSFSAGFLLVVWLFNGVPPLWLFMVWLLVAFFAVGILFGNFNALAMEPLGHMAGLGAAFVGSVSTFISLPMGWAIGYFFDNTVVPLIAGFAILGAISLIVMWWTERGSDLQP